ncbi:MAG TPA: N-acetylmuramoyl-L-alanine amidase [Candidatus Marinimicrobia bacterium]|nr:N-acetylmuramoyl-L-alanine amidase [Candidatus Neomarinimicrobiota bacterium]HJL75548.1 N-acetylmuramoyl-L-alanine amidase [Candidatus Neomarinimicrobiota bacterium]HJM70429.1 N-acetylmuramoyl-L-alanine amidase [Candidatus Neomarinimicrobiota bacterium]
MTCTHLSAAILVVNSVDQKENELQVLDNAKASYVSTTDLSKVLTSRLPYMNKERMKMVLYFSDTRIKISSNSSYVLVDEVVYHMPVPAKDNGVDIFLPTVPIFNILKQTVLPGITYDAIKQRLDIDVVEFNITNLGIEQKANGTILSIYTRERFYDGHISSFEHDNGWFYLTVQDGIVDTTRINKAETRGVIAKVTANQFAESAQISFRLRSEIIGHEVFQSPDPNAIVVTLRTPFDKSAERIRALRDRWQLDTVVLDAGHGGKDGGTVGKSGAKEKNIVLDITKRLGLLLEKKTNINVVYTREEDVFIPLWKRTQKANESNGKIFVSIHANSNPNRTARGFETYLLNQGKSDDAIELASRENAVIKLEEHSGNKYKDLTGENLIMATMAQSMFMKESEELAALIQSELGNRLDSRNRGVKQAGFVVLIGASMPNVLIETGFLSNPSDEKRLKQAAYRQQIAEGIFSAIVKFRSVREELLAEG